MEIGFGAVSEQAIAGQEVVPHWSTLGIYVPAVHVLPLAVKKVTDQFRFLAEAVVEVSRATRVS